MASGETPNKAVEKGAEWYRNFNLAAAAFTGALAVGAEAKLLPISPEGAVVLIAATAINLAQAGLAEVVRRTRSKKQALQTAPA